MKMNAMDSQRDQRSNWQSEWLPFDNVTYLNFAAHAPLPRTAIEAAHASIAAKTHPHTVDDVGFFAPAKRLRRSLGSLIGAEAEEVALTTGAGAGAALIAYALPLKRGDEILISQGEFPMHYATWKPMQEREGVGLRIVTARSQYFCSDDLIESLSERTRLVSVSHIRFDDGSLLDVPRLAAACRKNGTLLLLDISQSCGAVPIDVRTIGADFMVCAGYKYLLSPWGTGFVWVKKQHLSLLRPGPYNWLAQDVDTFEKLNYVNPSAPSSLSRWDAAESSSLYNFNLATMEAAVAFVLKVGPGEVLSHARRLTQHLLDNLPDGCRAASPLDPSCRGAFGCFTARSSEQTEQMYRQLRASHFVVALREGKIRISPHLINDLSDIDALLGVVSNSLRG